MATSCCRYMALACHRAQLPPPFRQSLPGHPRVRMGCGWGPTAGSRTRSPQMRDRNTCKTGGDRHPRSHGPGRRRQARSCQAHLSRACCSRELPRLSRGAAAAACSAEPAPAHGSADGAGPSAGRGRTGVTHVPRNVEPKAKCRMRRAAQPAATPRPGGCSQQNGSRHGCSACLPLDPNVMLRCISRPAGWRVACPETRGIAQPCPRSSIKSWAHELPGLFHSRAIRPSNHHAVQVHHHISQGTRAAIHR